MENFYLEQTVFPSEEKTILVTNDEDYGGAHNYHFIGSKGFENGNAVYDFDNLQSIQFVQKNTDGSIVSGVQSEQLIIALLDRTKKLNAKYPSAQNEKMIIGLKIFLDACKDRIEDRIIRGVMGDLEK